MFGVVVGLGMYLGVVSFVALAGSAMLPSTRVQRRPRTGNDGVIV